MKIEKNCFLTLVSQGRDAKSIFEPYFSGRSVYDFTFPFRFVYFFNPVNLPDFKDFSFQYGTEWNLKVLDVMLTGKQTNDFREIFSVKVEIIGMKIKTEKFLDFNNPENLITLTTSGMITVERTDTPVKTVVEEFLLGDSVVTVATVEKPKMMKIFDRVTQNKWLKNKIQDYPKMRNIFARQLSAMKDMPEDHPLFKEASSRWASCF